MIGATHNMNRCSGNSLPPPVDEQLSYSSASADKPIPKSARKVRFVGGHYVLTLSFCLLKHKALVSLVIVNVKFMFAR